MTKADNPPPLPPDIPGNAEASAPASHAPILKEIVDRSSRAAGSNLPMFIIVQYDHEADKASFLNTLRKSLNDAELYVREFDPVHNPEHGTGKLYPLMAEASAQKAVCLIFGLPREAGEIRADHEFIHYLNIYRDRIVSGRIRMILMLHSQDAEQFIFSAGDLWDFRHATYWLERPATENFSLLLDRMEMQAGEMPAAVADAEEIREHLESVRPLIEQTESSGEKADLLLQLCKWLTRKNAYQPALEAASEGLRLLGDERSKTRAELEYQAGFSLYKLDEFIDAIGYLKTALPIYTEIKDRLGEADCFFCLGEIQIRQDDLSGAKVSYDTALLSYHKIKVRLGEANCLQRLGDLQMRQSDLSGAKASYGAAISIHREIKDRMGEANCLLSLGDLQKRQDDLSGAKASYDAALQIYREIRARLGEANCLLSLGDLQSRQDDLSGAKASYDAALPIYREIRDRLGEANCLRMIGNLQMRQSDLTEAKASYDAALPIYREIRVRLGEANCLQDLGDLMLAEGKANKAFNRFLDTMKIYQEINSKLGEQASLIFLSRAAQSEGALDQALLLSEASLKIDRQINARYDQGLNLRLQLQVWQTLNEDKSALAVLVLLSSLLTEINAPDAPQYASQLQEKKAELTKEAFKEIEQNAEVFRAAAINEARERFEKNGGNLFTLAS